MPTYYPYDNGTVGPTGPEGPQGPAGAPGTPGVVQSVNGQSVAAVVLDADDVGALPNNANATLGASYMSIDKAVGNYRAFRWLTSGVSRWEAQADDVAETGSAAGSDFRLSARNDDGSFNRTVIHAKRSDGTISLGTTIHHGSAQVTSSGAVGIRDIGADPATVSGGTFIYSKGGVLFVKQADGTSFQISQISYPVTSVNGDTGAVTLGAADVGALPATAGEVMQTLPINGAAGSSRTLAFRTNSQNRWTMAAGTDAETGTDAAGTNLTLASRNDDGTFRATVLDANRSTGQVAIGGSTKLSDAKLTVINGVGVTNRTEDPAAPSQGFVLYAKDGLPYVIQADGTIFQVGSGGGGGGGAVDSVNGQTGIVTLDAADVGALPITGGELTGKLTQIGDGVNNLVEWKNSGGTIATRIGANGNFVAEGSFYAKSGMQLGSTNYDMGGGAGGLIGMDNAATVPTSNPTSGIILYSEGGVLKVRQADGQIIVPGTQTVASINGQTGAVTIDLDDLGGIDWADRGVANGVASLDSGTKVPIAQLPDPSVPSGFTPESMGLKAWAGDPDYCASGFSYTGVGQGRMSAVYVNRTMTVSKIVWHVFGYAGGLLSGSWAAIYNTSGTRVGYTGDQSTASYEPAEQHSTGGGWSSSNLTSSVSLSPGVYYVLWRWNYTASPVDGPALARFESASTCQSVMGISNNIWRHGSYTTSATTAPSSITVSNFQRDPIRFWVALA
ncbi:minor tail protein [Streptomyces phage Janus]|uniref:Minor tail protein n=1 Tax=Streptomyces phage Janus TaxID=2510525 RepID=A0A411CQ57_9CAUD|nr:minor tail protein [Streptomyces phage Janus]QAY15927.1 minor tail protein [Streptomyces phage Janus]